MTSECVCTIQEEQSQSIEKDRAEVKRGSVVNAVLCRLSQFWPVRFTMRALRGFWWLIGFSSEEVEALPVSGHDGEGDSSPARQCLAGRKRLHRATRLLLAILPRWMQSTLGYPVCTSIGRSLSPDVSVSPTKPCGKGSKRKQDELDEEEEEDDLEQLTWVETLIQEVEEEDCEADPDYEPSVVETDSEELRSQNDTESDFEMSESGAIVIKDLETDVQLTNSV